jgi:copper chaperone CopZ
MKQHHIPASTTTLLAGALVVSLLTLNLQSPLAAQPASEPAAAPAETTEKPAASAAPAEWHKLKLKASGSTCLVCLKDLEKGLRKIKGVYDVKTQKPPGQIMLDLQPDMNDWADVVILIDTNSLSTDDLKAAFKSLGYNAYHIVDKPLGHEPDSKDLKM